MLGRGRARERYGRALCDGRNDASDHPQRGEAGDPVACAPCCGPCRPDKQWELGAAGSVFVRGIAKLRCGRPEGYRLSLRLALLLFHAIFVPWPTLGARYGIYIHTPGDDHATSIVRRNRSYMVEWMFRTRVASPKKGVRI